MAQIIPSLEECYSKNAGDCTAPCVLEYQAGTEGGNPTCVPPVASLNSETLSNDEVILLRRIMVRLLPEEADDDNVVNSATLRDAFNTLHAPLYGYLVARIKNDVRTIQHTTWADSCRRISATILSEIGNTQDCFCGEPMNSKQVHIMRCCGSVAHLECLQRQRSTHSANNYSRPKCPWCNSERGIARLVPGPYIQPPPPDASAAIQPPVISSPPDLPRHVPIAMFIAINYSLLYEFLYPQSMPKPQEIDSIVSRFDEVYRLLDPLNS